MDSSSTTETTAGSNFIRSIIDKDLAEGKNAGAVVTRFPPEPNGYLHIGHASSICLNFGIARDYSGGVCHLRFDDTNPDTEEIEYVKSIQNDIRWLGFDWEDKLFFASDYFEQLYDFAVMLIKDGKAYVDSLNEEEIREYRGTVNEPGQNSPHRGRSVEENLDLLRRMRAGEFPDGAHVLRAKIDMASPNMLMRDPILYRIKHAHHYRTDDRWSIYPLYDFAHPLSDAIEGVTHSICTLEFEVHRPLYDWLVDNVPVQWTHRPHQHEFARRNLNYTVTSKRKLLRLVNEGHVHGWDDPRMPTVAGFRRRGYTPESIQKFCERIGISRTAGEDDIALLEYSIRDDLNHKAPRVMCVLRPLKVVISNYPEDEIEHLEASYWPHDVPKEGSRNVPFSREIYIERSDFREDPPKKFFRLSPGQEVRLRYGYIIKCEDIVKDNAGNVIEVHCTYDPESKSGGANADRKVKGTIHWVSASHAIPAEVRLYDRLFKTAHPEDVEEGEDFLVNLNPDSEEILTGALIEPSVANAAPGSRFQFERQGYFIADEKDTGLGKLVFNRIVTLRDTWAKIAQKAKPATNEAKKKKQTSGATTARTREEFEATLQEHSAEALEAFNRYVDVHQISLSEAEALAMDSDAARLVGDAVTAGASAKTAASWVVNVLPGVEPGDHPLSGTSLASLIALIDAGTISMRIGKDVLTEMLRTGADPAEIIEEKGLKQVNDADALGEVVEQLMDQFSDKVDAYRSGKTGLIGFFVGQAMKVTQGRANPQVVKELLAERLSE